MEHIVHEQNLEIRRLNTLLNSISSKERVSQDEQVKTKAALNHEIKKYEDSIEELKVSLPNIQQYHLSGACP